MTAPTCRLCGSSSPLWFERAGRAVHRCLRCRHIEVPAGLARNASGVSIYEAEDSIFTADGNEQYYLDDTNMRAARLKAAFVRRYLGGGSLLDVGASYGHFLSAISADFDARGFEVSPQAVKFSREELGVRNVVGSVYDWPSNLQTLVDAITSWDVIEHLEDPEGAIRIMRDHLKPGAWLFLSTPDAGSLAARLMGERWHYIDPVQHINLFSKANLIGTLARAGLTVRAVRSFGRHYRVSYVLNRLRYLHRQGAVGALAGAAVRLTGPVASWQIPVKLGDVVGLAAQAPD